MSNQSSLYTPFYTPAPKPLSEILTKEESFTAHTNQVVNRPVNSLEATVELLKANEPVTTTFRTAATSKGSVDNTASRQWANRPDDERYTSLTDMYKALLHRSQVSRTVEIQAKDIAFNENMQISVPDYADLDITNYTYNQLCVLANVPNQYLKRLPNELAAKNLAHGIDVNGKGAVKAYLNAESKQLRSINSTTYGRIHDFQVLEQVMKIAGDGVKDTQWKVPGVINWETSNGTTVEYNPFVDVTKETTTLYASDRDVFIFLVDDTHPIEIGKLPNGEPDLVFRGFYVSNSETGNGTFDIACMMMRGVCQNRNIWGVEGKQTMQLRHSVKAPEKFIKDAFPMLAAYSMSSTVGIVTKVNNAKSLIIAHDEEERLSYLTSKVKLTPTVSQAVIDTCLREEQHPMSSVWDAVQGITAYARTIEHQDDRVHLETKAGELMNKVSAFA